MVEKGKTRRLGKGLSALIGEVEAVGTPTGQEPEASPAPAGVAEIDIGLVSANPSQPRRHFDEESLRELTDSIRAKGVLQAILVRPDPKGTPSFQIIAGERRWRAARAAGLKTIPAVVKDVDELELLEVGIIENVQRTDLNPIEEAEAYGALIKRFGRTQESLAESVGKSRVHISNTIRLLKLGEAAREHLREGRITAGHARAALGGTVPDRLVEMAVEKGLSVREVERLARQSHEGIPPEVGRAVAQLANTKDVDTEALEADLNRTLGLPVDIRHGPKGGELRIKYRDLEQLDSVCRRLSAKQGKN